jgi:hypothetical protein
MPGGKVAALPSPSGGPSAIGDDADTPVCTDVNFKEGRLRFRQGMRGSAPRGPSGLVPPSQPRALEGGVPPVHPRPRGALPLCGSPALGRSAPNTSGQGVRPLGTRAQGLRIPETHASEPSSSDTSGQGVTPLGTAAAVRPKRGSAPFSLNHCRRATVGRRTPAPEAARP